MKNAINYYYNLYPINIYQKDKLYKFSIEDSDYALIQYNNELRNINEIYEIHSFLRKYNIYCHQILENNQKSLITNINNKQYVLLKIAKINEEKIDLNSITYYPTVTSKLHLESLILPKNWRDLWIEKIDYFEYQVLNFKKKFPLISKTSSYFIGLAENGIQLLYGIKNNLNYCISHHRIRNNYTLFDLYNPLEFIVDYKVRDIAEYFKEKFFFDQLSIDEVKIYINNNIFDANEATLFFGRLLYPSYYFDLCDDIIYNNANENKLSEIITKNSQYEKILSEILYYLRLKYQIPEIEWLKKS